MAVTVEQFITYIGGDVDDGDTVEKATTVLSVATTLVHDYIRATFVEEGEVLSSHIPQDIIDLAILRVGEVVHRQRTNTPSVMDQFNGVGQTTYPFPNDPMLPAYPLLRGYVLPW